MTPAHSALWLVNRRGRLEMGPAPYTSPGDHEIVVRNRAVAVNPIDVIPGPARLIILPWQCVDIVHAIDGAKRVACASPAAATALQKVRARRFGIRIGNIWGATLKDNEVGLAIYRKFLPRALQSGTYAAAPEPLTAGNGLNCIPDALANLRHGVSARKVVVTL